MTPLKIFTPCPILGYGYDLTEFWHTIETERPAAIIVDGGSTDPGPYMLGSGKTIVSRQSYITDITPILDACAKYKIKFLIGSAGGAGTNAQVDIVVDVIRQIAEERGHQFVTASIKFQGDRGEILDHFRQGKLSPCSSAPELHEEDILGSENIVAQMGAEPFLKALENADVDIIVAGRSYDPAPFAAFSLHYGIQPEPAWHVGKIIECGGLCATPKGRSIVATMHKDHFILTPTNPRERCTQLSVASHTMYEKTRPDRLPGPGGVLHLDLAVYEQQPDKQSLLVRGSKYVPTPTYQIKLEGAVLVGYRSSFIGGIRDPILIRQIDHFLEVTVRGNTKAAFPSLDTEGGSRLIFHIFGKNAVMGSLESSTQTPHEVGVLGEVTAATQDEADAIANLARICVLHNSYPGQVATAGNLASPLTPLEQSLGPVYKFSVYHLMDVENACRFFDIDTFTVGTGNLPTPLPASRPVPQLKDASEAPPLPSLCKFYFTPCMASSTYHTSSVIITHVFPIAARSHGTGPLTIADVATVVRSKNSGPFEITLDILFDTPEMYAHVRDSNVLTVDRLTELYRLDPDDVVTLMFFEPALGWKCTYKRPKTQLQGSVGERDTFGAQLHAPLLGISVPPYQR